MIYVHLPFCKRFCAYCDFHSATGLEAMQPMLEAILREWDREWPSFAPFCKPEHPHTLYLGGGTPSLYAPTDLQRLVNAFREKEGPGPAEITIEANPNDLSPAYCEGLRRAGFNRLSLGVQALQDRHLQAMGRRHNVAQAYAAIDHARKAGFTNLSLDFILGFPGLTQADWAFTLREAMRLRPEHISAYQLSIEPETPWGRAVEAGTLVPVAEEEALRQYRLLQERLTQAGYVQYEISNFALPGYEAVHNSGYWAELPYLGLGAGAHSYTGDRRWANVADNAAYLRGMAQGSPLRSEERLSEADRYNERVMLGLRRARGLDLQGLRRDFPARAAYFQARAARLLSQGFLQEKDGYMALRPAHYFIADSLIRELFYVDPTE